MLRSLDYILACLYSRPCLIWDVCGYTVRCCPPWSWTSQSM